MSEQQLASTPSTDSLTNLVQSMDIKDAPHTFSSVPSESSVQLVAQSKPEPVPLDVVTKDEIPFNVLRGGEVNLYRLLAQNQSLFDADRWNHWHAHHFDLSVFTQHDLSGILLYLEQHVSSTIQSLSGSHFLTEQITSIKSVLEHGFKAVIYNDDSHVKGSNGCYIGMSPVKIDSVAKIMDELDVDRNEDTVKRLLISAVLQLELIVGRKPIFSYAMYAENDLNRAYCADCVTFMSVKPMAFGQATPAVSDQASFFVTNSQANHTMPFHLLLEWLRRLEC